MLIPFVITAISTTYPDMAENKNRISFLSLHLNIGAGRIGISVFYPPGEPISLQQLRCRPFAVVYYSFMGHFLAVAAILARE